MDRTRSVARIVGCGLAGLLVVGGLAVVPQAISAPRAAAAPTGYVTVSDGTRIAINVRIPDGVRRGRRYPTIFEMSGYDGGSADGGTLLKDLGPRRSPSSSRWIAAPRRRQPAAHRDLLRRVRDRARLGARHGCSSGEFDMFSGDRRSTAARSSTAGSPSSRGRTATSGSSATRTAGSPAHGRRDPARRTCVRDRVSGLIDDLYRGTRVPGRRQQLRLPAALDARHPPRVRRRGGLCPGSSAPRVPTTIPTASAECEPNAAREEPQRPRRPAGAAACSDTDNEWYRARSLITAIDRIQVPMHITGAYQDEQTGPRGPAHLYESAAAACRSA